MRPQDHPDNPFCKDDRVRIRPGWKKKGARAGTVWTAKNPILVSIIWYGTKTPATYHIDLVELANVNRP